MDRSNPALAAPPAMLPGPDPVQTVSPWVQREADTFAALQRALAATPTTAYQPPAPFMLPRLRPEWILGLAALGALDPTKTVVPQFAQGFLQGGMMNSQNEAQRRQAAIEAEREAANLRLRGAELEHRRASQMLEGDQRAQNVEANNALRLEIETLKQQGYSDRQARDLALKLLEIETVKQPNVQSLGALRGAQAGAAEATGRLRDEQATDLREKRPAQIAKLLAEGKGKEAHAAYEESKTAYQNIVNKYADDTQKAKLKEIQSRITKNLAQANNSLANAAKARSAGGATGTATVQGRYLDKQLRSAQEAVGEIESSMAYLDQMEKVHQQGLKSADPEQAAQAQAALGEVQAQKAYLTAKLDRAKRALAELMPPVDTNRVASDLMQRGIRLKGLIGG